MPLSYRPEVYVSGEWCPNGLRFATREEAEASARELLSRWFVPTDSRAAESTDPVNYRMPDVNRPRDITEV